MIVEQKNNLLESLPNWFQVLPEDKKVEYLSRLPWEGFVAGSERGDTKAKDDIWLDEEQFKKLAKELEVKTINLVKVADLKDLKKLKVAFEQARDVCSACHKEFRKKQGEFMKWITRERPKIDRIACPWLIQKFIDQEAKFLYVPAGDVLRLADETGAIPYDIPKVELSHVGELCSFDAFLKKYQLVDPALDQLALIVRGADTSNLDLTPQSAGLYAISLGLSSNYLNDHEMLEHGLVMYEALYAWCKSCQNETHNWPPKD